MSARTRDSFRDSLMSRAARAMFAFLYRNAQPVDASAVAPDSYGDELQTLRRMRERATVGAGVVSATTYLPSQPLPRRRRTDRQAPASSVPAPNKRAS